jgi:C-terminal processing protease CtpA/Prc
MRSLIVFAVFALSTTFTQNVRGAQESAGPVLTAISSGIARDYYDQQAVRTMWPKIEHKYATRIKAAKGKPQALRLIRQMLSELHNSHILFYSKQEWAMRQNVLPFSFEKSHGRVFVRAPYNNSAVQFGDEVISIDGKPASALRPRNIARLDEVTDNPLYGNAGSTAELKLVRNGKKFTASVQRIRFDDGGLEARELFPGTVYVALRKLSAVGAHEQEELQEAWRSIIAHETIVLDLRDCSGGWPAVSGYLLDSFLGSERARFVVEDRSGHILPTVPAFATAPRFENRLIVLQNRQTQSECEMLSATLKEAARATILGETTAGAFNGFTTAIDLPGNFALFALPYTKSRSPSGYNYEGVGVRPDTIVRNNVSDFHDHKDAVLQAAEQIIKR